LAINADGGMKRWGEFSQMSAHQLVGGALWPMKGQGDDALVAVELHRQWASHSPLIENCRRPVLEPALVASNPCLEMFSMSGMTRAIPFVDIP
jgi:hypothetical protein